MKRGMKGEMKDGVKESIKGGMMDARLKLLCVFLLSLTAYISTLGAVLVFIWWLIFTKRSKTIPSLKIYAFFFLFNAVIAAVMILSHNPDGIGYFIRMSVILLTAGWAYSEITSRDMLNTFVWLFGEKYGFEAGLITSLTLRRIKEVGNDYSRTKTAFIMRQNSRVLLNDKFEALDDENCTNCVRKGKTNSKANSKSNSKSNPKSNSKNYSKTNYNQFRLRDNISVIGTILIRELIDSNDYAKVLASRGYIRGGKMRTEFVFSRNDIPPTIFALAAGIASMTFLVTYL